jgi:3-oxoacyl-[acyl-carrier-protein] synthase II
VELPNYFDFKFKTQFACELKTLMLKILDRKEARKMDRYAQYAMVSSEEAVNDAGFNFEN